MTNEGTTSHNQNDHTKVHIGKRCLSRMSLSAAESAELNGTPEQACEEKQIQTIRKLGNVTGAMVDTMARG